MRSSGVSPGTEPRCACWSQIRMFPPNPESPRNSQALAWASAKTEPAQKLLRRVRRFSITVPSINARCYDRDRSSRAPSAACGNPRRHHGNFLFLPEIIPVFHRTVAHRTRHACICVLLVTEEDKVWKRIHPFERAAVGQAIFKRLRRVPASVRVSFTLSERRSFESRSLSSTRYESGFCGGGFTPP